LRDKNLIAAVKAVQTQYKPAQLIVTLSEQGMLLGQHGTKPVVIPTVAQEVYDVSGAGDTVIASFTLAITAGASPLEAAIFSNHAAGVVVGKMGTATVTPQEMLRSIA
jgi:D-beta-D-heptose 7-phosphate kinase/D-beta-D-heptose 1-phosphate adenosyltransferase